MSKELLQRLPLFAGLSEPELDRLLAMSETISLPRGDMLMREGDPGDAMYVVLDGELEISKQAGQGAVVVGVRRAGEMIGETAMLQRSPRTASVRALVESHLVKITQEAFDRLISSAQAVAEMLRTVTVRLSATEAMLRQSEKMAALGTLAAGLAHELNNPAAAIKRSSAQLGAAISAWEAASATVAGLARSDEQNRLLAQLRQELGSPESASPLDPLTQSDQEAELEEWLDEQGVAEAWEAAAALAARGWRLPVLRARLQGFAPPQQSAVAGWLAAGCKVYALLHEVDAGSQRISAIVGAVRSYTFLDQAPIQDVNLHEGIDDTLTILGHNLKDGVTVSKEYAPNLPTIEACGSELNQVWTNIIDNAVDAIHGHGQIVIRTEAAGAEVAVEICDSGPGIPPDVQERIFEPFFTTKPPGSGTGLGLHITYNIVRKHRGQISVRSQPGSTCFRVTLPVRMTRAAMPERSDREESRLDGPA